MTSAGSTCAATGSGDIADTVDLLVGGTATYTATGTIDAAFVGDLVNMATIAAAAGVTDPDTTNDSATDATNVTSPAMIVAEKVATGEPRPGATIAYVVTLINTSAAAQLDNPGDEMVDVLPSALTPLSATASSGTTAIDAAANTVTWNGTIPGNGTVEITIDAQIDINAAGQTVDNQATFFFDADGDGANESSGVTDDPETPDDDDATSIRVLSVVDIPTLGGLGMALLVMMLSLVAVAMLQRRRDVETKGDPAVSG